MRQQCDDLLSLVGVDGPGRRIAGMEGILNRRLVVADRPNARRGEIVQLNRRVLEKSTCS
jgi:hypothetical protein